MDLSWAKALFEPTGVAVFGASAQHVKAGNVLLANLTAPEAGFQGRVVAVHPTAQAIGGVSAVRSIAEFGHGVNLAVIATPPATVPGILADCAKAGIRAAIVVSGGFAEAGEDGQRLQASMLESARTHGIRLIGPNCFGAVNTSFGLNASIGVGMPRKGGISLFTQSGAYGMAAFARSEMTRCGFAKIVSVGNKADVNEADILAYLASDGETRVIAMLLESFSDGRRLFELARTVTPIKPVVLLKTGRGQAAQRAASSHTAALADDWRVAEAALRQAEVRVVYDGETLIDVAEALDRGGQVAGRRVGVITNSGGVGVELADLLEREGSEVPALAEPTRDALRPFLPVLASTANPIDVTTDWLRFPESYGMGVRLLSSSGEVDAIVVVLVQRAAQQRDVIDRLIVEIHAARERHEQVPVFVCWLASTSAEPGIRRLQDAAIPCFRGAERVARVIAQCRSQLGEQVPPRTLPKPGEQDTGLSGWLSMAEALAAVRDADLPLARFGACGDLGQAAASARELGYPVVLKADRPGLLHKTEARAVRVDIADEDELRAAWADFDRRLGSGSSVVQEQASGGVELAVGGYRDAGFGPVVLFGIGGVWIEVLRDFSLRLAPLNLAEAHAMMDELRFRMVLDGVRGSPAIDREALAHLLVRVSAWFEKSAWLEEFDFNPVIAGEQGLSIVDARIKVRTD
ncbi:acetate--CoA ligase family protein [Methylocaldum sp.]|uniref:acetate--CoA ligase family protein n=1 Tax=Methylocaldum sp. TaxID=1969727 RepID=UPI002D6161C8|nr:acetate--CoA ligase family protein [Methylocaldum sp.]HYE34318.1 acetate--CoA ligase family protein [Methylocaldum sp.]